MSSPYKKSLDPAPVKHVLENLAIADTSFWRKNLVAEFIGMIQADTRQIIPMTDILNVAHIIETQITSGNDRAAWAKRKTSFLTKLAHAERIPDWKPYTMANGDLAWQRLMQKEPSPSRYATYLTDIIADPETSPGDALNAENRLAKTLWDNLGTTFATRYTVISWPVLDRAYLEVQTVNERLYENVEGKVERDTAETIIGNLYHWDGQGVAPNRKPARRKTSPEGLPADLIGVGTTLPRTKRPMLNP